ALPVTWDVLAPLSGIAGGLAPGAPDLNPLRPGNVMSQGRQVTGDVTRERGAHSASGAFRTSYVEHAYIEPEAGFARRVGDRIEVFVTTQTPYMDRDGVAHVLGIAPERVRIVPTAIGGGFGGKIDMSVQPIIAVAAWL